MNVFDSQFVQAVKEKLNSLQPNERITQKALCESVGVDGRFTPVITLILQEEEFSGFDSRKGPKGGIGKKSV
jgi:hypothetical protein